MQNEANLHGQLWQRQKAHCAKFNFLIFSLGIKADMSRHCTQATRYYIILILDVVAHCKARGKSATSLSLSLSLVSSYTRPMAYLNVHQAKNPLCYPWQSRFCALLLFSYTYYPCTDANSIATAAFLHFDAKTSEFSTYIMLNSFLFLLCPFRLAERYFLLVIVPYCTVVWA